MRAVLTRVKNASVEIEGNTVGKIEKGLLVLLGVHVEDTEVEAKKIADRICKMRIFEDEQGRFNISPSDAGAGDTVNFSIYFIWRLPPASAWIH